MKKRLCLTALVMSFALLCSCSMVNGAIGKIIQSTKTATASEEPSEEVSQEPIVSEEPVLIEKEQTTDSLFGVAYDIAGSFNPITSQSRMNQNIIYLIYEGLFELTPDYEAKPVLCKSFEMSGDELVYTFTLRDDVTFHNGKDLTADDVVYSLSMAVNAEASVYSSRFHSVASITALDESTVQIVLGSPYEQLPIILDVPIIPEGSIDEQRPMGTGPFMFTGVGEDFYLEGYSGYRFYNSLPFKQVYLFDAESSDTLRDDFETSRIDILEIDPTGTSSITFHNDYELLQYDTNILQYIGFNYDSDVFSNEYARRAVCYAVDRKSIVTEVYGGKASEAVLPCGDKSILYDEALANKHSFNTAMMKQIMQEGGFKTLDESGLMYFETSLMMQPCSVTFIVNSENTYKIASAEKITEVMRKNGFAVSLQILTYDDYMYALKNGEYDMYLAEVKLAADFDLTDILNYYGKLNYGLVTYEDLSLAILGALENSGAALDLYITIYEHGLMVPVLFKDNAVISPRGMITNLSPTATNCFYGLTNWKVDFDS